MSWRNPGKEARDAGLTKYLHDGVLKDLEVTRKRCADMGVHAVGYCLGGTLQSIATATLARARDSRLRSVTLLAKETDSAEFGELGCSLTRAHCRRLMR